jgi:rubrerythrin
MQLLGITRSFFMIEKAIAFRQEFYEPPTVSQQIIDDVTSYLGEYRFAVPDFDYRLGMEKGRIVDPNTGELMTSKAAKAIELRRKSGLRTSREEAELEGLIKIEKQLRENPFGTVIWFSPPGASDEGYGKYGFGYVGKRKRNVLEMTAIRLEGPSTGDFNRATKALWRKKEYQSPEDFLRSPRVVNIDAAKVKEFIHGAFEIGEASGNDVFRRALNKMRGVISDFARIEDNEERRRALYVLENLAIELKAEYEQGQKVVYITDYRNYDLRAFMANEDYVTKPPVMAGSCGSTGKVESNDIFKSIGLFGNSLSISNQEWFTCPKCHYKADGPVGDTCPGCGLTKEEYVEESGADACA